ncbi:MAG: hypothetical protein BWY22_00883 [Bacteroidetes bacterium ADurb.Bin217]|nr:MAG: hypothetical protein BWY22_00883 [Bacteroidetes bacterium ADurb.Bin217]
MKYVLVSIVFFVGIACNQRERKVANILRENKFVISEKWKMEEDTIYTVLYLEKKWDSELHDTLEKITVNDIYIQTASPEAKYILGYASILAGTDCWWQGEVPNSEFTNLQCLLLSSLDMGCQCSKKHIDTLMYAFSSDSVLLSTIQTCTPIPYSATYHNTCDYISIEKKKSNYILHIKARTINMRKQTQTPWEKRIIFTVTDLGIEHTKIIDYSFTEIGR